MPVHLTPLVTNPNRIVSIVLFFPSNNMSSPKQHGPIVVKKLTMVSFRNETSNMHADSIKLNEFCLNKMLC